MPFFLRAKQSSGYANDGFLLTLMNAQPDAIVWILAVNGDWTAVVSVLVFDSKGVMPKL